MDLLIGLENSGLGQWVASDTYAEPILLCFHAIGMGVVVGIVWMFGLRILGAPPRYPLAVFHTLKRIGWAGFAMNLVSGAVLFAGSATRLIVNFEFQLKMALVALGGVSIWGLSRLIQGHPEARPFPAAAKVVAAVSALLWLGAIFAGRYIAYTLKPPF